MFLDVNAVAIFVVIDEGVGNVPDTIVHGEDVRLYLFESCGVLKSGVRPFVVSRIGDACNEIVELDKATSVMVFRTGVVRGGEGNEPKNREEVVQNHKGRRAGAKIRVGWIRLEKSLHIYMYSKAPQINGVVCEGVQMHTQ